MWGEEEHRVGQEVKPRRGFLDERRGWPEQTNDKIRDGRVELELAVVLISRVGEEGCRGIILGQGRARCRYAEGVQILLEVRPHVADGKENVIRLLLVADGYTPQRRLVALVEVAVLARFQRAAGGWVTQKLLSHGPDKAAWRKLEVRRPFPPPVFEPRGRLQITPGDVVWT